MVNRKTFVVALITFLLPWQTVWLFSLEEGSRTLILGQSGLFLVEIIIALSLFFFTTEIKKFLKQLLEKDWWAIALVIFFLLFGMHNWYLGIGLTMVIHLFFAIIFFFLIRQGEVDQRMVKQSFLAGLLIPLVIGILQVVFGNTGAISLLGMAERNVQRAGESVLFLSDGGRLLRAYGSFPHPNVFGGYMAVAVVLAFLEAHKDRSYWLFFILLSGGLFLSFSRTAWLAVLVSLGTFFFIQWYKKGRIKPKQWISFLIIVISFLGVFFYRIFQEGFFSTASVMDRLSQYILWPQIFFEHLFFGTGIGGYIPALIEQYPNQALWSYQPIHQTVLLMLAEMGIIGFGLVAFSVGMFIKKQKKWNVQVVLFITLLSLSLFDHYLWTLWPGVALVAFTTALVFEKNIDKTPKTS